jgi:hypothetical protein
MCGEDERKKEEGRPASEWVENFDRGFFRELIGNNLKRN